MSETHHNPRYESSTHAKNETYKLLAGTSKIKGKFASSDFLLSISNVLCDLQVRHFAGLVVTQNTHVFSAEETHRLELSWSAPAASMASIMFKP